VTNTLPVLNPAEVAAFRYIRIEELKDAIAKNPEHFTPWLPLCLEQIELKKKENDNNA